MKFGSIITKFSRLLGVLYDLVGFSYNLLVLQALCLIVIVLNCLAWAFPAKPAQPTRSSQPSDRSGPVKVEFKSNT